MIREKMVLGEKVPPFSTGEKVLLISARVLLLLIY